MKIKFNLWSFIFSFVCIALFFISVSSYEMVQFATNLLNMHPLNIVFTVSLVTFVFGLIGFSEATNWILLVRSVLTIIITLGVSILSFFIIFMGNLFEFT